MIIKKLEDLNDENLKSLLSREVGIQDVLPQVNEIILDVAENGDEALLQYTKKFDGASISLQDIRVSQEEIEAAYRAVDEKLLDSLMQAAENIIDFHNEQKEKDLWFTEISPGVIVGQKVVPLDSVGAYVPGGRAAYPSSALMNFPG